MIPNFEEFRECVDANGNIKSENKLKEVLSKLTKKREEGKLTKMSEKLLVGQVAKPKTTKKR